MPGKESVLILVLNRPTKWVHFSPACHEGRHTKQKLRTQGPELSTDNCDKTSSFDGDRGIRRKLFKFALRDVELQYTILELRLDVFGLHAVADVEASLHGT